MIQTGNESRKEWLLHKFSFQARITGRAEQYKMWTDDNHAIYLDGTSLWQQKIDYIHNNPVRQMIVALPEEYLFSSACDYADRRGLVNVTVVY